MRSFYTILFLCCAGFLKAQHYYYTPNSCSVPLLNKNRVVVADAGWGSTGLELRLHYQPVHHLYVSAAFQNGTQTFLGLRSTDKAKYRFMEFGAGVYDVLDNNTASLSAGYGLGESKNQFSSDYAQLQFRRLFAQLSVSTTKRKLTGAISFRFSHMYYTTGEVYINKFPEHLDVIAALERDSPYFLPEISLLGVKSYKRLSVALQITSIFPRTTGFIRNGVNMYLEYPFNRRKKS